MLVRDVMTSNPVCCRRDDRVSDVARLMRDHDCGIIPVCDGTRVVGVVTDRDIACRAAVDGDVDRAIEQVMTKTVFTVRDDEDVQNAIDLMEAKQVRRLPVINAKNEIAGIVAPSDLAPTFASMNVADFLLAVSYWTRPNAMHHAH